MKTIKKDISSDEVKKLTTIIDYYERFDGSLLDNYIFYHTETIRYGRCQPRKFIVIKEVFVNEWTSKNQIIMTDNELEIAEFKRLFETPEKEESDSEASKNENSLDQKNHKSRQVKSVLKLEQKFISEERSYYKVNSSIGTATICQELIGNNANESLLVLCLNTKNEVTAYSEIFKGTVKQSLCNPREVFQFALLNNASRIVLSHCHPSGNVKPSANDNNSTANISRIGRELGIELLDHVIVTNTSDYYSYQEEGEM